MRINCILTLHLFLLTIYIRYFLSSNLTIFCSQMIIIFLKKFRHLVIVSSWGLAQLFDTLYISFGQCINMVRISSRPITTKCYLHVLWHSAHLICLFSNLLFQLLLLHILSYACSQLLRIYRWFGFLFFLFVRS